MKIKCHYYSSTTLFPFELSVHDALKVHYIKNSRSIYLSNPRKGFLSSGYYFIKELN